MQTMTDEKRKLEIGDVEKLISKIPNDPEITGSASGRHKASKMCSWYQMFIKPGQPEGFYENCRQSGCPDCKGLHNERECYTED